MTSCHGIYISSYFSTKMQKIQHGIISSLILVLFLVNGSFALDECPDQRWFHIEGDCFLFILQPRATFQDAQITCQAQHSLANLAKINPGGPEYQLFLESRPLTGIFAPQFLIGLSDTVTEGEFRWLDGTWPTSITWAPGHPVRISREVEDLLDCVIINDAGNWESVQCIQSYSFVCAILDGEVPGTEFDECSAPDAESLCPGPNDVCEDAIAGYHCVCLEGYFKNDNNECQDINECVTNPCGINEECNNIDASFTCTCLPGHTEAVEGCVDIDECSDPQICIGFKEVCTNFAGGFTCECESGFQKDGRNICVDVDECTEVIPTPCSGQFEICMNTPGSFVCLCETYFTRDVSGVCVADNACCPTGFRLIGGNCHIVINDPKDYPDAEDFCESIGGFLSKIEPLQNVAAYILENYPAEHLGLWIGLDDIEVEGTFRWVADGSIVGTRVNLWGAQEPLSFIPSLDCVYMTVPPSGNWHTSQCGPTIRYPFACQRPALTACPPVNHCGTSDDPCIRANEICQYVYGNHRCTCVQGFSRNANTEECEDVDECTEFNFCSEEFQECENTIGSYQCLCQEGTMLVDGLCQDINECLTNPCDGNRVCRNFIGSYTCICADGFRRNGTACDDIDECEENPALCTGDGEYCTNLPGSSRCDTVTCPQGYRREDLECFDIDECALEPCTRNNEYCINYNGSYECLCTDGTSRDINNNCIGVCCPQGTTPIGDFCYMIRSDPDDYTDFNTAMTYCRTIIPDSFGTLARLDERYLLLRGLADFNVNGEFWIGFEKDRQDSSLYRWSWDRTFVNTSDPRLWCQGCPNPISGLENCGIVNVDTFLMDISLCSLNLPYICQYRQISCDNSNPCERFNPCEGNIFTQCVFEGGQIRCVCLPGYQIDPATGRCVDIECTLDDPSSCSGDKEICRFTSVSARGFYCDCIDNYARNSEGICEDIDECETTTCPGLNRQCVNTEGSYSCICRDGFFPRADGECVAEVDLVKPCESNPCVGSNVMCMEVFEEYNCVCDEGFQQTARNGACQDVDECAAIIPPCQLNSVCINTVGSYNCECLEGYERVGDNCNDINECVTSPCRDQTNTECVNLSGSYICQCPIDGFFINQNGLCVDVQECIETPDICSESENRVCVNTVGSYICVCADGFDNIDGACVANSEAVCFVNTNPCSAFNNEVCINNNGVAECVCRQGFFRSGVSCLAVSACNANPNRCASTQLCVDTAPGEFRCDCRPGFVRDVLNNCVASDICLSDMSLCTENVNEVCVSVDVGAFECNCRDGFVRLDGVCTAENVCAVSLSSLCGTNQVCMATGVGQFECNCIDGFVPIDANSCGVLNPCDVPDICNTNEVCVNTANAAVCNCIEGYSRQDGVCQPDAAQNPCNLPDICGANRDCISRASGSIVCVCTQGYVERNGECQLETAISPCAVPNVCGANENCREVSGQAVCDCVAGYTRQDGICQLVSAISPCAVPNVCGANEVCTEVSGQGVCDCVAGYTRQDGICQLLSAISPCAVPNVCGANEVCTEVSGQAVCDCVAGYTRQDGICQLLSACSIPDICGVNEQCDTLIGGSVTCNCRPGYSRQGGQCQLNLDPCLAADACGLNEVCTDVNGDAQCSCAAGFSRQNGVCSPVTASDPCLSPTACEVNEDCSTTNGQVVCFCSVGFTRSNGVCQPDVPDPCTTPNVCGANEGCFSNNGEPLCSCLDGYTRRNGVCVDASSSPCGVSPSPCTNLNEECVEVNGLVLCECIPGFARAGLTCVPEGGDCTLNGNDCVGTNEECAPLFGIPVCQCFDGYARNSGGECVAVTPGITCFIGSSDCGVNEICIQDFPTNVCICQETFERNANNDCTFTGSICEANPNICPSNAQCIDDTSIMAGYRCECIDGFMLTPTGICTEVVIDVCLEMPQLCPGPFEVCITGDASTHTCECQEGYWRLTPGAECTAINQCLTNPCTGNFEECEQAPATNLGYICVCSAGYERATPTAQCTETVTNPCLANPCTAQFEVCQVNGASFTCACEEGYARMTPGADCTALSISDPCTPNPCSGNFEMCIALGNDFSCPCISGYTRLTPSSPCTEISACIPNPCTGMFESCQLAPGTPNGYTCECIEGYTRETAGAVCTEVSSDACMPNPCDGANEVCERDTSAASGFICNCQEGYERNADTNICEETACNTITACSLQNEFCLNGDMPGLFSCECLPGFIRTNDGLHCVSPNIDEICSSNTELCNSDLLVCQSGSVQGEYRCECMQGYVREEETGNCIENSFSESACETNAAVCNGFREVCVAGSIAGSYRCVCEAGYEYINSVCTEQTACESNPCPQENEICQNLPGGRFRCDCATNYTRRDGVCVEVLLTKCALLQGLCGVNEDCIDLPNGDHTCECSAGHVRFPSGVCEATCAVGVLELCGENAECIDTPANTVKYRCDCNYGFIQHENRCFVSPTCSSNPNPCGGVFEQCVDVVETGIYRCDCLPLYHRVEGVCTVKLDCCPHKGTFIEGVCYEFIDSEMTFDGAQNNCSLDATGGYLAKVVPSRALQNFMSTGVKELTLFSAWIGLTNSIEWDVQNGAYTWLVDRETVPTNHPSWQGGALTRPCVVVNDQLTWDTITCSQRRGHLCQYDAIPCVDPPPPESSNECLMDPCDASKNLVCVNTPQSYICNCKPKTEEINGKCLYVETINTVVKIQQINGTQAVFTRQISESLTTEFKQLSTFFCDTMLNAITTAPAPNETDCRVQRFEEGSIIAHYQIRVGEENPALAEEYLDEFEDALEEIVIEEGRTIDAKDGQGTITIEKLIRDECDRLECENDGSCLIVSSTGRAFCKCPSDYEGTFCEIEKNLPFFYGLFSDYWFGWLLFGIPVVCILLCSICCYCVRRMSSNRKPGSALHTVVAIPNLRNDSDHPQNQPLVQQMESAASTPEEERRKKKLENDLKSSELFNKNQQDVDEIPMKKQPPPVAPKPVGDRGGVRGSSRQTNGSATKGTSPANQKSGSSPGPKSRTRSPSPSIQKRTPNGKGPETGSLKKDQTKAGPERGSLRREQSRSPQRNKPRPQGQTDQPPKSPGGNPRPERSPSRASQASVGSRTSRQGQPRGRPTSANPAGGRNGPNQAGKPPQMEGRKRSPSGQGSRSPNNRQRRKINGGKVPKVHKGPETAPTIYI